MVFPGKIGEFVSVYEQVHNRLIFLAADSGRVCRPLIIVDPATGQPRLQSHHVQELVQGFRTFDDFLKQGQ